ncbi:MAG: hypothetical protein ABWZ14_09965 [Acidimicrobiales bacterium]
MGTLRFNHMELTLPKGALGDEARADIKAFYGEVFDFEALDVPLFDQLGLLLRTDDATSQFLLLMESNTPIDSPGYDHLGFLYDTREQVDDRLEQVKRWQEKDDRVRIKEYEDLVTGATTVHAFYVRYLLPIWFDVQHIDHAEPAPARED